MNKSRKGSFKNQQSPQRRLSALWGWLPAFRTTAETGSLSAAARLLELSPSAVSRSLRLLEEEVGEALFHRADGAALRLNPAGERLFAQVRAAMRLIDDGLPHSAPHRVAIPQGIRLRTEAGSDVDVRTYKDLDTATCWLGQGDVDAVLVVGVADVPVGVDAAAADIAVAWWSRTPAES